jgi:transcriptional regulator with XRE-family HTH domain
MPVNSLKQIREKAGFTRQNRFAKAVGIPVSTIANFETGYSKLSDEVLNKIADFLNCSVEEILAAPKQSIRYPSHAEGLRMAEEATGFEGIPVSVLEENFQSYTKGIAIAARHQRLPLADKLHKLCLELDRRDQAASLEIHAAAKGSASKAVALVLNEHPGSQPSPGVGEPSAQSARPRRGSGPHLTARPLPEGEVQAEPQGAGD